jgi:hypothetical protein
MLAKNNSWGYTRILGELLFKERGLTPIRYTCCFPSIQLLEVTSTSGFGISMASDIRKSPSQSIAGIGTA